MRNSRISNMENRFDTIEKQALPACDDKAELSSLMATAKRLAKLSDKQGNFSIRPVNTESKVGFVLELKDPNARTGGIWARLADKAAGLMGRDWLQYTIDLESGHIWQVHDNDVIGDIVDAHQVEGLAKRWVSLNADPPKADRKRPVQQPSALPRP
ncbi:MAG: hypothetical protein Alpg2KO_13050 [Alphaproteobacteria bacterium]